MWFSAVTNVRRGEDGSRARDEARQPATAVTLVAILLLGVALDLGWKRRREAQPTPV